MAGFRFTSFMSAAAPLVMKHAIFVIMLAASIWIFFVGLTLKSDNPALRDIAGAPLSMVQDVYV